ncbi:trifunctional serine/threonine-protein kinase/ATP-binding protein/sensor histidine kinase [Hyalangium rubrum]|uniref:ATP-binding sensor histidine kinase n=1 Tax=Hyalangium rubrum TaxID=3103134 RepID=A0ABU5HH34_9BACT|nr:ATP-binding sensor histidine kinase [Hyalangium sp. s54d21]MDY7232153.1 ATP-binding sensor histidine kinase [Hyalangium sp. s54d21]
MMELPGYTLLGLFQTTSNNLLFRAVRKADARPVIVKTPRQERPGPRERARYMREHGLLQRLQGSPGVLGVLGCEVYEESPFLILEDVGGQSLSERLEQPWDASRFLPLANSLATTLTEIHRRGVVHRDIKPHNILLSEEAGVWLIDFGLATLQQVEHVEAAHAALLEGTLAYMSPEQSGRMNRAVDYRTDLYSLGVTLYQLLTGQLPFHGKDALEWIHAHIAQAPEPPHARVVSVPPMLSAVVLKLLAKPAEERYQSADGLKADLERCLQGLRQGRLEDFPLGQGDFPTHFQLPQRLYGREAQLAALQEAFERVARGERAEWVWVSGYAGIGKSSVVHELHKPILRRRGFFLSGKFNQLQRDVPYSTLAQALRGLVQQLLAGSNEELEAWRQHLLEAFEGNGQVLVDLVPQFAQVVGKQPPVPELPSAETRNRFNRLFLRLLGVFARAGRPLVLFLDDLQWADLASLKLLQTLVTHPDTPAHLLIGAYRDNEVSASHPLAMMLEEARKAGGRSTAVHLEPLSLTHTRMLVAEALPGAAPTLVAPLAELLQEKTGGNPFFLLQLFQTLHQEGLVTRGAQGDWRWDAEAVRAREYSDNVVDFMAVRLRQLPDPTQQLLHRAACVGNTFALETLSLVSHQQVHEVEQRLEPALLEGLVVRTDLQHLRFFHDRIQQAAYSLIAEEERRALHLEIGRLLWARLAPEELHERLFEVVGQLNAGARSIEDPEERSRLAQLNIQAGFRAKASTAYRTAIDCFTLALSLLPGDPWQTAPEQAFQLRLEQARGESASGNLAEARRIIEEVLPRAPTRQHLVAGYQLQGEILLLTGEARAAAASLLEALARLGVVIPAQPTWEEAVAARQELESLLGDRPVESLLELPALTDPEVRTIVGLLVALISPAFFTSESLLTLELCKLVTLSLRHGNTAATGVGYAWYGLVTSGKFREYRRGYEFGRLAQAVTTRYQGTAYLPKVLFTLGQLSAWVRPLSDAKGLYQEAFQHALQAGDFQTAAFSGILLASLPFFMGTELSEVYRETVVGTDFSRKINFRSAEDSLRIHQCFVQQMRGLNESFTSLSLGEFSEAYFESRKSSNLATQYCWYAITKARSRFMCGAYEEARQSAEQARPLLYSQLGRIFQLDYHHYRALSLAACYREAPAPLQQEYLEQIQKHQEQLADWSASCPETFSPVERMVFAELERLRGRPEAAMQAYEEAIQAAHTHGQIQNVAVASELAARFWKERGYPTIATSYARQAREAYSQWGAEGKVRHMDEQWPRLADLSTGRQSDTYDSGPTTQLDALSLVKAQQAISSEMHLQKLVATLMNVALQSAGAQRGALVLSQGDELQVKAVVEASAQDARAVPRQLADQELPWTVLSYVKRTGEHVLIDDTAEPHPFSSAPFFSQSRARCLLCLPLTRNQQLRGMLYLENSLAPGAFSPARISLLQYLASHAVISLENAQLYTEVQLAEAALRTANEELEVRVEERTHELKQAQAQLLETARLVGMAEVASNVLHEVGNTLTSLVVSTEHLRDALASSRGDRVGQVAQLLEENQTRLSDFLTEDPRGRHIVAYLRGLSDRLAQERTVFQKGLKDMASNVERVRSIVSLQQNYGKATLLEEECELAGVVEEALRLKQSTLKSAEVQVTKRLQPMPRVMVDRHRLLQILLNLLSNARHALEAVAVGQRRLELRLWRDSHWAYLEVEDTGQGITPEVRKQLFTQGFSTRRAGHGLGLHSSALTARLMRGQLTLESPGPGLGATAILKLPVTGAGQPTDGR